MNKILQIIIEGLTIWFKLIFSGAVIAIIIGLLVNEITRYIVLLIFLLWVFVLKEREEKRGKINEG